MTTKIAKNPAPLTYDWLVSWILRLGPLHGAMLQLKLDLHERRRLGGLIKSYGPGLVVATGRGIAEEPHLFPDAPASGPDLVQMQQVANCWAMLRNRLERMARLAQDAWIACQAPLTNSVYTFVWNALTQPSPAQIAEDDVPARNFALIEAYLIVDAYYTSHKKKGIKAKKEKAAARASAAAPASTTAGVPVTAAQIGAAPATAPATLAAGPPHPRAAGATDLPGHPHAPAPGTTAPVAAATGTPATHHGPRKAAAQDAANRARRAHYESRLKRAFLDALRTSIGKNLPR